MNVITEFIDKEFKETSDLKYKSIRIGFCKIHIYYLETLCSGDKINDYILKNLSNKLIFSNIEKIIPSPTLVKIDNKDKIKFYMYNGYTILIHRNNIYAFETKAELDRSISEATTEPTLFGPKDSLVENIVINLGLVKRRLKSNHLKTRELFIGRNTLTKTNILYIDNITDMKLVSDIETKLKDIDMDAVLDSGTLKRILDNDTNPFPSVKLSERPDTVSNALLSGKLVILVDGSPYAIILPAFLIDFINPIADNYSKPINNNFLKIMRLVSFFLSIIIPSWYIAVTNYNQETIPLPLLLNF